MDLELAPAPASTEREELEAFRRRLVASWEPVLRRQAEAFSVEVARALPPVPEGMSLAVGVATGDLRAWPAGALVVPLGEVPLSRQTELLRVRLQGSEGAVAWMQRVTVEPGIEGDRDTAALSSLMGCREFHAWMRRSLSGDALSPESRPWDADAAAGERPMRSEALELLTLEDIVGCWGRDQKAFLRADRHFDRYVEAILEQDVDMSEAERASLKELQAIWALTRERLVR